MDRLHERYQITKKAIASLDRAIKKYKNTKIEEERVDYRDIVIKRFECSLDTLWKYLKDYLEVYLGIVAASLKAVMRKCHENKILSAQEAELALDMVDSRSESSHTYNEAIAQEVSEDVVDVYYTLMNTLLERTNPSNKVS